MLTSSISTPATTINTMDRKGPLYDGPFSDYFAIDRTSKGLLTGLAITGSQPTRELTRQSHCQLHPLPQYPVYLRWSQRIMLQPSRYHPSIHHHVRRSKASSATPSKNLTETASNPTISFVTVVLPSSSPYTPDSFSLTSVKRAKHKLSKLSEELRDWILDRVVPRLQHPCLIIRPMYDCNCGEQMHSS